MNSSDFTLHGAVDLGARKAAAERQAEAQRNGGSANVIDVTEETFNSEIVERSQTVPVVIDFWADWCQPCKQLSPILEKLAEEAAGAWVLAKVDVDANQRLAAGLRVQSLPTVLAVVDGQVVNGFMGALPERDVREWLQQLMSAISGEQAAPQEGVTGSTEQEAADPALVEAAEAINQGDLDRAAATYQKVLDQSPADVMAKAGLAQVELMRRTRDIDQQAARRAAASQPGEVDAQCQVADIDLVSGRVDEAFDRLIGAIRRTAGDERDQLRRHLLELFEVLPPDDPRVVKARASLANALF